MILVKLVEKEIVGWISGNDVHEIRIKLESNMEELNNEKYNCQQWLYLNEFPCLGKHDLGNGFYLLVG